MQKTIRYTQEGYDNLLLEEKDLTAKRISAVVEVKRTREMGDLSENSAYRAAKWQLGGIDRRLRQIKNLLDKAFVVQSRNDGYIGIGSYVELEVNSEKVKYEVVGGMESDIRNGKISERSPLGKALIGRRKGETVNVFTPSGLAEYKIVDITV